MMNYFGYSRVYNLLPSKNKNENMLFIEGGRKLKAAELGEGVRKLEAPKIKRAEN